jgi:hydrogenase-4 component B
MAGLMHLDYVLLLAAGWLVIGVGGLLAMQHTVWVAHFLFPLGALPGIALCCIGLDSGFGVPQSALLPLGLPGLPFHLRLDALASFFLSVLGLVSTVGAD